MVPSDESPELTAEDREKLAAPPSIDSFQRERLSRDAKKNWDLFYKRNGDRFFKNRHWTKLEFPELFELSEPTRLLEIGCGCGDFALPLVAHCQEQSLQNCSKASCDLFVFCCDISDRAIDILKKNRLYKDNHPARIKAFCADLLSQASEIFTEIDHTPVDLVSLIFILSALDPDQMLVAIRNIYSLLRPGGLVIFRDYAIYDKAMLRFSASSKICDQFYVRQDGTRAYFFSKQQLVNLFESHNFSCKSIDYVRRQTVNHATHDKHSRIFLQAKFERGT